MKLKNWSVTSDVDERWIAPEMMHPQIAIDAKLNFGDINDQFIADLNMFAPFGPENLNPIFVTKHATDYGTSKRVGKENVHLKLELLDSTANKPMNGIAFRQSRRYDMVKSGQPFDLCYTLEENIHNGKKDIQLYVKDIDRGQLS